MPTESLTAAYFERLYAVSDDPWSFATSRYELDKYDDTVAALGPHYPRALEIGCSVGVLTRLLAPRCGSLLAVDINERALHAARERCADLANVTFARAVLPHDYPPGRFDLVVLSEVGYYWSDVDLALARDRIAAGLEPGGELLLVHFLPKVEDYVRDGDAVHAAFLNDERFAAVRGHRTAGYRLDLVRSAA
ncbi:MAG TPA: class I SAM-dependent methyltransferase [Candidatus Elarobacter sp.]|nr:class I SAM-dependent methyltransferase [Candidatus Elarobacter sp.]